MTQATPPSPFPGVYQLRVPMTGSPLKYINAYLLPGEDGHLLVDTGWNTPDSFQALSDQFEQLGLRLADLRLIIATHAHLDHYGLIKRLVHHSGARVGMHEVEETLVEPRFKRLPEHARETCELLRRGGVEESQLPSAREMIERFGKLAEVVEPDFTFGDGEVFSHQGFELAALWTPGHSPGHVCLYEAGKKLLFSGDHVLAGITPNIGIYPQSGENPLGDYLCSLDKVEPLEVDLVLPAHGEPFQGLAKRVGELRSHHRERNHELLDRISDSGRPLSPCELAGDITWHAKGRAVKWRELPLFDQRLAVFEVMAHLEAMAFEGILDRLEDGGLVSYLPA